MHGGGHDDATFRDVVRIALLAACIGVLGSLPASTPAEAGTPYWCTCHGKPKRFIGATKACQRTQHVKTCSAANFRNFKKAACASNGCKPR